MGWAQWQGKDEGSVGIALVLNGGEQLLDDGRERRASPSRLCDRGQDVAHDADDNIQVPNLPSHDIQLATLPLQTCHGPFMKACVI